MANFPGDIFDTEEGDDIDDFSYLNQQGAEQRRHGSSRGEDEFPLCGGTLQKGNAPAKPDVAGPSGNTNVPRCVQALLREDDE